MVTTFRSELISWREVLRLRTWTIVFFSILLVSMVALFLVVVSEYRLLAAQVSQLTTQVEVIAEVDQALPEDQIMAFQKQIEGLPMVSKVEYWPAERSAQYIDRTILSGYLDFLKKTQLSVPVNPLFRIQLRDLDQKPALEKILGEQFGDKLLLVDASVAADRQSFAGQFVQSVTDSVRTFRLFMILEFLMVLALSAYLTAFLLAERSRGFHLSQFLHLSPPYLFFPAFLVSNGLSLILTALGFLCSFLFSGQLYLALATALLGAVILINLMLCWLGRYVLRGL